MIIIYFLVAILSTVLGSMAGIGGGVIIKPVLDLLGHYPLGTISILSSVTVFTMAVVSVGKQIHGGFKLDKRTIFLAVGALIGGIIGKQLFSIFVVYIGDEGVCKMIQSIILALLMLIVLFKSRLPQYNVHNKFFIICLGLILGVVAAFLGIGGGPINVAVIYMFLAMPPKDAAVSSIFVILLSQFSKLTLIAIEGGLAILPLPIVIVMGIGAVAGGLIGARLNRLFTNERITLIFNIVLCVLFVLNIYNAYTAYSVV